MNSIQRQLNFYFYLLKKREFSSYFRKIILKVFNKISNYLLLDWKIVFFSFIIFGTTVFLLLPNPQINLPPLTTMTLIVETILRTLTIIFGLLVAFTTLSFSIFNKYYGRSAFYQFFKNKYSRKLFTLFVTSVIFNSYALAYLKESTQLNPYEIGLFFLSISSSIVVTFSFFPTSISMLSQAQSLDNIEKIITAVDEIEWLWYYTITSQPNHQNDKIDLKKEQEDPVKRIIEIGISSIKDFDYTTLELILIASKKHFFILIEKRKSSSILYSKYCDICDALFQVASSTRNDEAMKVILRERFDFEMYLLTNNLTIDANKDFSIDWFGFALERYFNKALRFNEDEVIISIIHWHKEYISEVIHKLLPSKLVINKEDKFHFSNEASTFLSSYRLMDYILKSIADGNKIGIWEDALKYYAQLDYKIMDSPNSIDSKGYLLRINGGNKLKAFERYISTKPQSKSLTSPYTINGIESEIQKNGTRTILNGFYKSLDILYSKELLIHKTLNDLKAIALLFVQNLDKKPYYKKLLIELVERFEHFGKLSSIGENDYKKDLYLKLYYFFSVVEGKYEKVTKKDDEITAVFTRIKSSFNLVDIYKEELSRKGFLSEEDIV